MDSPPRKTFTPSVTRIHGNIAAVVYPTKYQLMYSFARLQEFYENPELKERVFTRQELQDLSPDYYVSWSGCNVPGAAFRRGVARLAPLDRHEAALVDLVGDAEYVIGAARERGSLRVLLHELAHARFSTDREYRVRVTRAAWDVLSTHRAHGALATVMSAYHEDVHLDEFVAYTVCRARRLDTPELQGARDALRAFLTSEYPEVLEIDPGLIALLPIGKP